jgi:hypothetical protein
VLHKEKNMKNITLIMISLVLVQNINAQTESCKVLLEKISETYSGECQDGLANGKGTAKGEDTYTGVFKDGLPEGKGKYIYKNGEIFKGYWKNGLKDGKGKFEYSISGKGNTLVGYWKNDVYVGVAEPNISYKVAFASGILQYKVEKIDGDDNVITFTIVSGISKIVPRDLKFNVSSGRIDQAGKELVISQYFVPFNCDMTYTIAKGGGRKQCHFMIDIIEKGKYKVTLSHD